MHRELQFCPCQVWQCLCFCFCDGNVTFDVLFILLRGEFISFLQGYGIAMNMVWFLPKKKDEPVSVPCSHLPLPVL
jgi:hypothetical protein